MAVRGDCVAAEDFPGGADEVVGVCCGGVGVEPLPGFGGGEEGVCEDGLAEVEEVGC